MRWKRLSRVGGGVVALGLTVSSLTAAAGAAKPVPSPGGDFSLVSVHPWAAAQPTVIGRQIVELEVHDGQVWAGYGDYGANTGPITVASLNPSLGTFTPELVMDTEAVYSMRVLGDRLVIPATDPRRDADFATGLPLAQSRPLGATHVYDTTTLTGSDLWMVGSQDLDAVAWRSLDGGVTWTESLRVAPTEGGHNRFYFAANLGDQLVLQAYNSATGPTSSSSSFDGFAWTSGPSLLANGGLGWEPTPFKGGLVYAGSGQGIGGSIYYFDGATVTTIASGFDFAVSGDELWVLGYDGEILKSADLQRWRQAAKGPAAARSIAVDTRTIYLGTADSAVWAFDLESTATKCSKGKLKRGHC